jgi:CRISPR-associated protein Cmr4
LYRNNEMKAKLLFLFTRTPLHVGAGVSNGAIDRPLQRERHTGLPIIPGTTLKGVFAAEWTDPVEGTRQPEGVWLFGSGDAPEGEGSAGALQFSEAKLLAFPVRSARGSFAWITSPLILRRWARDGGISGYRGEGDMDANFLPKLEPKDGQALFARSGLLAVGDRIVLEEYTFMHAGELPGASASVNRPATSTATAPASRTPPAGSPSQVPGLALADHLGSILSRDPVWSEVSNRLVIVSDGMMSFFSQSACEIGSHAAIDDARGATDPEAIFNQENVPGESMFYASVNCFVDRNKNRPKEQAKSADQVFAEKIAAKKHVFQFGANASTGLGFCTVELKDAYG